MVPLVELGNRHSSRASALSYSRILQLVFLFRIFFCLRALVDRGTTFDHAVN